jgi:predicted phosphohydrolase
MKFTWATDIHLDFLSVRQRVKFYDELNAHEGEAVLLTGDIGNAQENKVIFNEIQHCVEKDVYFVLGNHDYWGGTFKGVKSHAKSSRDHYLGGFNAGIRLCDEITICGVDGWYDLEAGRLTPRGVSSMRDFRKIKSFTKLQGEKLLKRIRGIASRELKMLKEKIKWSLVDRMRRMDCKPKPKKVIILTHFPPFRRASLYYGAICEEEKAPFYVNQGMGEYLGNLAADHPDCEFTVLCGHSHSAAHYIPLPNLNVRCGKATYGKPEIQEFCEI